MAFLLALAASLVAPATQADEPPEERWYQVETLIFRYPAADLAGEGEPQGAPSLPPGLTVPAPAQGPRPHSLSQLKQLLAEAQERQAEAEALAEAAAATGAPPPQPAAPALGSASFLYAHQSSISLNRWLVVAHQRQQQGRELPYYMRGSARWAPTRMNTDDLAALPMQPSPAFSQVEESGLLLSMAQSIIRSPEMELIHQQSWVQPVGVEPTPILIQAGTRHGDMFELEGTLALSRPRQLRVAADLWITIFEQRRARRFFFGFGGEDSAIELDEPTQAAYRDLVEADKRRGRIAPAQRYLLQHARAIQPNQLHYLDHPLAGLLITLRPTDPPTPESAAPP